MARIEVHMPQMGESLTEGTVVEWRKKPGDAIELDESLLEIGTDKVDTDVPSPVAGVVSEILVPEGETVEVGTVIAVIESDSVADAPAPPTPSPSAASPAPPTTAPQPPPASAPPAPPAAQAPAPVSPIPGDSGDGIPRQIGDGRFFSPLVRSIAEKEGLGLRELASVPGSGRDGRITKKDVLEYLQTRISQPVAATTGTGFTAALPGTGFTAALPGTGFTAALPGTGVGTALPGTGVGTARPAPPSVRILSSSAPVREQVTGERIKVEKMDRMRLLISEHMARSKSTSAHVTSFAEVDVTNLVMLRERNKEAFFRREGVKLTYTPFFVFAAVEALRDHPILNASVVENEIHYKKDFHVGIAVALGKTGLVVPVIRDAGQKNFAGLAQAAADLAERTRTKKLLPDELQGGTFTVSNVGSVGSIMGTPIINQPQVGILATGTIQKRPVVIEDPMMGDTIGIRSMMYLSLSYDHRVVDGAMGASFLSRCVEVLQSIDPTEVIR